MRDSMIRKPCAFAIAVGVISISFWAASAMAQTSTAPNPAARSALMTRRIERGRYLVTIGGCNDCHTPLKMGPNGPEPDMSRMLSGHPESMKLPPPPSPSGPWIGSFTGTLTAFAGPWGIAYAANLTPDKNTGTGGGVWSEDVFVQAMRTGKHFGTSRPIQPPMPWNWLGKATDEDLRSIWAYLQSIPPVANHVPDWQEPAAPAASSGAAQPSSAKK